MQVKEATVRTGHETTDWFQLGKGVHQGCILSPCLFNCYAEYIMRNPGLEDTQAGIKISKRNINNMRYADDTTLMTFSFFSLQILLFMISFLPPYFGYHFLVIMELRGKTSKDTVWKLQHLYHFSMSSENQDIFRKDNEFGAIELIPCNISTLRVRSLAFT